MPYIHKQLAAGRWFTLTLADPRHQDLHQELLRLREILCDVFQGEGVSNTSFEWLSQHFLEYGIAVRLHR